jgi:hypothetical protein
LACATPKLDREAARVAIGIDGTCMLMCREGYREAMSGTVSVYARDGERLHTIYRGATPQYGKASVYARMAREIEHVKALYPQAIYAGVADEAPSNREFLAPHTDVQVLDFYHATHYLADAAKAASSYNNAARETWFNEACHDLKHKQGAATGLLKKMQALSLGSQRLSNDVRAKLGAAITYFSNHKHQMSYARYRAKRLAIGSGVTEAPCRTLLNQRLCNLGMRWVERGAKIVLGLRALMLIRDRWEQFWAKINQYGLPISA